MNRTELQAKVTSAIRAIELLETACADKGMKSWDKTAIHIEELSRIKAELQNKYSPLISELPATKPDPESELSKDDRMALAAYNRYEKQLAAYEVFIARKTSYHSNIGKTGFLVPELDREVSSEFPYPKKYEEDAEFAKALKSFEQHKATYGNLKNMLQRATPDVIRGLLEDFINSYRTLRLAVEKERNRIQAENATKEALWKELNEISSPLVKVHGINLQKDEPYKTLGANAALIYAQVGNAERNRALQEIIDQLKINLEQVNKERAANLIDLDKKIEEQAETFTHLYKEMASLLESAGIDDSIIADVKDRFVTAYEKIDSETDEVVFKTRKLAALKELRTEFDRVIIDERKYISSGVIKAIDDIANKFAKHLEALDSQLENRGIKFGDKEQALIEYMKRTFNINPAYKELVSPDALKAILDDVQNKAKEFDIAWPKVVEVVKQGQQTRIAELKDNLIPQQQKAFQHFYSDIKKKLTSYGLWEQHKDSFVEIQDYFNSEYGAIPESDSHLAPIIDFYQAKQSALNGYIEELRQEILNMQEAICTAMVKAVDAIADRVEQEQYNIQAKIQDDFVFTAEERELLEKMDSCSVQRVAEVARSGKSPEMLEPMLKNASEKEKLLQEILPAINKAIERCRVVKIAELQEAITNQKQAFKDTFSKVHTDLGTYGLDQAAVSEINEAFDNEFNAINEDEIDPIQFHKNKLHALKAIATRLDRAVVQAENDIVANLKHRIDSLVEEIEARHREALAGTLKPEYEYQFDENEQALADEFKTSLPKTYQGWTVRAQLEEHIQALKIQKDGLVDKSQKINKMVALHNEVSSGFYDNFFIEMNMADKDEATVMLAILSRYLVGKNETGISKLQDCIMTTGFQYITNTPAIEAIEALAKGKPEYSDMLEQLNFIKLLSAKGIDAVAYLTSDSTVEVVNLLHEKGLDKFITKELLDNSELIKALSLINQYSSVEINESLMTDKGIALNKMAIVINKIDSFVNSYVCEKPVRGQLERFREAAIPALLTDKTCEEKNKELCTLAHQHFEHQHFARRVLADVLQFITLAFIPIMLYRGYKGKSLLFSQAETNRETQLKQEILPDLVSDKDVPQSNEESHKVEP